MPVYNNTEYTRIVRPLPEYVQRDRYGIPVIEPDDIDIHDLNNGKWLVNLHHAKAGNRLAPYEIVHSFATDQELDKWYNSPYLFLKSVGGYYALSSFDFSMSSEMDEASVIHAVYKNRWMGAFLQSQGKRVIPTVGWTIPKYYDVTFAGLHDGGTFLISTLGICKDGDCRSNFLKGYEAMRKRFPNTQIICVGNYLSELDSDVCLISFQDSFGFWPGCKKYWQPKLWQWNMSVAM